MRQQVVCLGWGTGFRLAPATADLEAVLAGQCHHGVVVTAVPQGGPQGRIGFAQGHKGIQLAHFVEKLLQVCFSHGIA
jgi:hypothetical protein